MTSFYPMVDGEAVVDSATFDESLSVAIVTEAEDGHDVRGGCSWMNSASVYADPDQDQVVVRVSVADPRGGLCMTVCRLADGTLILHVPHEDDGFPHVDLTPLHPGTFRIGSEGAYADDDSEDDDA